MHGHTGGGSHIPPPHLQPRRPQHPPAGHPNDPRAAPPAPWDPQPRQGLLIALIRNPRVISALIVLTITVVLLVLFTF
jgi:hypothetical protein